MMPWTPADIPDQTGRTAIVTGSNSGIGFDAALHLAASGAHVILACRNETKADTARAQILEHHPSASVQTAPLDLANLESVEAFSNAYCQRHETLDLLINNAGLMIPPFGTTKQGFELQFGTNHLGHFALTGRLLPALLNTPQARVVTIASNAHRFGRMDFDDPNHTKRYIAWEAYGQSKLANLLFAFELQRRLDNASSSLTSIAAHPGFASTKITRQSRWMLALTPVFGQSSDLGAWPTLRAATDPGAEGGSYWGPRWMFQLWGAPVQVRSNRASRDASAATRLWALSEQLTGVSFLSTP